MLVSEGGLLKVADFGTSRFIEIAAHGTTVIGSPPYMAPEQFHGKTVFASDIYSLGVTMYQMLTGVLPYNTPAPADLDKLMKGELVAPPRTQESEDPGEDQRHRHEGGRAGRERALSARQRSVDGSARGAWQTKDHACDSRGKRRPRRRLRRHLRKTCMTFTAGCARARHRSPASAGTAASRSTPDLRAARFVAKRSKC